MGKGGIARYEQFLLFPQCFQNTYTGDTLEPRLFGKGLKLLRFEAFRSGDRPTYFDQEAFRCDVTSRVTTGHTTGISNDL